MKVAAIIFISLAVLGFLNAFFNKDSDGFIYSGFCFLMSIIFYLLYERGKSAKPKS